MPAGRIQFFLNFPLSVLISSNEGAAPIFVSDLLLSFPMSSPSNLEISGNLSDYSIPELFVEILGARIDGSLRASHHNCKSIFYFRDGRLAFAISNQRQHRIFEMLLTSGILTKQQLVGIPDFTNDFQLLDAIRAESLVEPALIDPVVRRQTESIVLDAFTWRDGQWAFTALARVRGDIDCGIDARPMLIGFGRKMPRDAVIRRFKSLRETFGRFDDLPQGIELQSNEIFVLSQFDGGPLRIEQVHGLTGFSEPENLQLLYSLWLGGFLFRAGWKKAISDHRIAEIHSARLAARKAPPVAEREPAKTVAPTPQKPAETPAPAAPVEVRPANPEKPELSLDNYLNQVEKADTHYRILNVDMRASTAEIKAAYFALAKRFHPDLYYRKTEPELHRRIQDAFTEIAHAYETLRHEESRQRYDFKLRKVLDELGRMEKTERESAPAMHKKLTEASEIFDHGFNLLMDDEFEAALPYLLRAVSMAPGVARYHAYYGKVLSVDPSQKFKAESELQAAVKLEPENPTFRLMLAEFFIDYNLMKRAEGELNRLLSIAPDNVEARVMLDRLQ